MDTESNNQKVILAGVFLTENASSSDELRFDRSMEELSELCRACNMEPVGMVTQQLPLPNHGFYLGTGKLQYLKERAALLSAEQCIINDTLTPTQLRNLQKETGIPVMDRTALILEIFRKRARSREAKLQVELASLQYLKPRLIGLWETQNRQGGASGSMSSKGEGETQLELDRRQIDHRLAELKKELAVIVKERETRRKKRQHSRLPLVSLVGYTNAGKSAIMNGTLALSENRAEERSVFEENMLFATLDTSVRRVRFGNFEFMLSDTVGFVDKLPTALVEAFKSTLEEVREADLLLHVIDYSDPDYKKQEAVTEKMIEELSAGQIPRIKIYNKADRCFPAISYPKPGPTVSESDGREQKSLILCAKEASSLEMLCALIQEECTAAFSEYTFFVPYDQGGIVSFFRENCQVLSVSYEEKGTLLKVRCQKSDAMKYQNYLISPDI